MKGRLLQHVFVIFASDIMSDTLSPVRGTTPSGRIHDLNHLSCARQTSPLGSTIGSSLNPLTNLNSSDHIKPSGGYSSGAPATTDPHHHHENKPKIWSIANVVTADSLPHKDSSDSLTPSGYSPLHTQRPQHNQQSSSSMLGSLSSLSSSGQLWSSDSSSLRPSVYPPSSMLPSGTCGGYNNLSGTTTPQTGPTSGSYGGIGSSNLSKLNALASQPLNPELSSPTSNHIGLPSTMGSYGLFSNTNANYTPLGKKFETMVNS